MSDMIGRSLGQYEITELLGEGGMATVYRARQATVRRDVAIKIIEGRMARSPEFLKRFEREAMTIAALDHPHIIKVFDYGEQDGNVYLVMELKSGGSLAQAIGVGGILPSQAAHYLDQIAGALDHAHSRGVVHRDLKPQNVLLDQDGNVFLTDFGIAKLVDGTTALTHSGVAMGTPAYMSPEQCQGGMVDARSDLYALGILLFEMLTGELPFKADTPVGMAMQHITQKPPSVQELRNDLPESVARVVLKALAKRPEDRFQKASTLASAFRVAVTGTIPLELDAQESEHDGTAAISVGQVAAAMPHEDVGISRRGGRGLIVIAALALTALVIGGMAILGDGGNPTPAPTSLPRTAIPDIVAAPTASETPTSSSVIPPTSLKDVPTNTVTVTITATRSDTPAPTATNTLTATSTNTATATSTDTPTVTPTLPPTRIPAGTSNSVWTPIERVFNGVPMVLVPAGCFMMGSNDGSSDEKPVHGVCLDRPFWIDKYEVSQAQFRQFSGQAEKPPSFLGDKLPVENIDWFESKAFCEVRSARLPTEAEWEYAARGPKSWVYPWGDGFVSDNVIYGGNSGNKTSPVGSRPDGVSWVGAFDLSGNVREWMMDWYDAGYYSRSPLSDPQGPGNGSIHAVRGGSWGGGASDLRLSSRSWLSPDDAGYSIGLRCVRPFAEGQTQIVPGAVAAVATPIPAGTSNTVWTPVERDFDGVMMVLVPAGCFMMGSDNGDNDEIPVHEVCLDRPFWIDKHEVSQAQFAGFNGHKAESNSFQGSDLPVENITWFEAASFCELRDARLPTEAEWEYAARGPESKVYSWGDEFNGKRLNYCDISCEYDFRDRTANDGYQYTAPVGSYRNGASWVGTLDMSGNVWEWVTDWYNERYYAQSPQDDPRGPSSGQSRVVRGGSWDNTRYHLRTSVRLEYSPTTSFGGIGFRCARFS